MVKGLFYAAAFSVNHGEHVAAGSILALANEFSSILLHCVIRLPPCSTEAILSALFGTGSLLV